MAVIAHPEIDVVIEATGDPASGIKLCLAAIRHGKHIVMVNVEADALAGPLLARRAREAGVVYSLAWGDQPALIAEHVDWARACGFKVVSAGKGTRYHPSYHQSTPDTVWDILTQYLTIKDRSHINPKMFNSFLDGTKSGIEMTAVCNATGLVPQTQRARLPAGVALRAGRRVQAQVRRRHAGEEGRDGGGVLALSRRQGRAASSGHGHLRGDREREPLRRRSASSNTTACRTRAASTPRMYRPTHMIGLELGISVASAALRKEPTGTSICFNSDVAATAKRALKAGEMLDGEGGFTVWGKQVPADVSLKEGYLPLGLAHAVKLKSDIAEGQPLRWSDVAFDASAQAVKVRREMEAMFARPNR